MNIKKTLALFLVIAMCFSFVPSFAFANDDGQIVYHGTTEQMSGEYSGLFIADSLSLSVGGSATLVPRYYYNVEMNNVYVEGDDITSDFVTDLTWTSNNPAIATVSNGVVTGVSAGTTTIEISATDQYDVVGVEIGDTCEVTVTASSLTVTFNPNGGTLEEGTTNPVTVTSGSTVGEPTVSRPGYTLDGWYSVFTIEGFENKDSNSWNFNNPVNMDMTLKAFWTQIPATGISLVPSELKLDVGESNFLSATVEPEGALIDSWESSAPGVATVDSTGKVTAVDYGSAIITVRAGEYSATCTVAVTKDDNVAYVNGTGYTTLAGALAAANSGDMVILAADFNDVGAISLPAGVTLHGTRNGVRHTISGNSAVYINAAGGTVRYVNFENINNSDSNLSPVYANGLAGTATITGVNFNGQGWDAIQITPVAGANIVITNNEFRQTANFSDNARRFIHVQSGVNVDFSATVTGNKMYGSSTLIYTGIELYFPADWSKITLGNNFIDTPIGVCLIGPQYDAASNRYDVALNSFVDASGNALTIEAVVENDYDTYLFPTLEAAFEYAQDNNLTDITLVNDATVDEGAIEVENGETVVFDLNGHSVTAAVNSGTGDDTRHFYALSNYGTLTLKDSNPGESNGVFARGISNEVDGVMVVDSGRYVAVDTQGGAAIWNEGALTVNGGTLMANNVGSVKYNTGAGCLSNQSTGTAYIHGGTFTSVNERCYAILNYGTMTVDENNETVTVNATHGALACNYGTLTVDGGSFTSQNYYGLWITNDGDCTEVTVNGGSFQGGSVGKNALRASVDDGKQDVGDATITITGGKFKGYGNNAAAVAVNKSGSAHSWGMAISGGLFSTEPDSSYLAEGFDAVENTDPATAGVYPYTVGEHVHNFVFGNPTWLWRVINGTWSVTSTYVGECSCGATTTETLNAEVDKVETLADITYTATDSKGNSDTRTFQKTFTVTYEGSQLPETFTYGQACRLAPGDGTYDWYVKEGEGNAVLRAKGAATFYFPVTANVTVTKEKNASPETQTASSAVVDASSPAAGQYRFKFVWSIPEGSQVQSAMVYRCMDTHNPLISDAEELLQQSNLRFYNTNLYVRNGEFTLSGKNLTSGTTQTIMFRLVYTLNGETKTLDTALNHITIS